MESDSSKSNGPVICSLCEKVISRKSNLKRHIMSVHESRKPQKKKFICHNCARFFSTKSNLGRHLIKCDINYGKSCKDNTKCCLCYYYDTKHNVLQHYIENHGIDTTGETLLTFKTFSDFQKWKDDTEKRDISKYIRFNSKKSKDKICYYYRCHRDGFYRSVSKNIRQLKRHGSNKINGYCPSKIDISILRATGEVNVRYLGVHIGHNMDLRKIPLSKAERDTLADKVLQNMPFDEIIHTVRNSIGENINRLQLVTKKDLYNLGIKISPKSSKTSDVKREKDEQIIETVPNVTNFMDQKNDLVYEKFTFDPSPQQEPNIQEIKTRIMDDFKCILEQVVSFDQCHKVQEMLLLLRSSL